MLEAFRNFLRAHPENQLQPAQIDEELDFAKLRLRQEIVTAAFSNDAGATFAAPIVLNQDPTYGRLGLTMLDADRVLVSAIERGRMCRVILGWPAPGGS